MRRWQLFKARRQYKLFGLLGRLGGKGRCLGNALGTCLNRVGASAVAKRQRARRLAVGIGRGVCRAQRAAASGDGECYWYACKRDVIGILYCNHKRLR